MSPETFSLSAYNWHAFFLPVIFFAFSMSATPGPNNIMLTASGARYGFRRTLAHRLGISIGFFVLLACVAAGLGGLFMTWPVLQNLLRIVGSLYLLWLAWRIASAPPPDFDGPDEAKPFGFLEAAAFQFANPKAWLMAVTAITAFTRPGSEYLTSALLVTVVCALVNFPSISMWAGFGSAIGRYLRTHRHWRVFNGAMGLLTAACVVLILH